MEMEEEIEVVEEFLLSRGLITEEQRKEYKETRTQFKEYLDN